MSAVLAPAVPCLRDVLADALWIARAFHLAPGFTDNAKAALYGKLHDAAVTAPGDDATWNRLVAAHAEVGAR